MANLLSAGGKSVENIAQFAPPHSSSEIYGNRSGQRAINHHQPILPLSLHPRGKKKSPLTSLPSVECLRELTSRVKNIRASGAKYRRTSARGSTMTTIEQQQQRRVRARARRAIKRTISPSDFEELPGASSPPPFRSLYISRAYSHARGTGIYMHARA